MNRAGRIVLIEDISRSDRARLPTYRPAPAERDVLGVLAVCSVGLILVAIGAAIGMVLR